jgi:hypothetical protein
VDFDSAKRSPATGALPANGGIVGLEARRSYSVAARAGTFALR